MSSDTPVPSPRQSDSTGAGALSAGCDPHYRAERVGDLWSVLCMGDGDSAGGSSSHTNVNRVCGAADGMVHWKVSERAGAVTEQGVEAGASWATSRFISRRRFCVRPMKNFADMLEKTTGRPCHQQRGVDTECFLRCIVRDGGRQGGGAGRRGKAFDREECEPVGASAEGSCGDGSEWGGILNCRARAAMRRSCGELAEAESAAAPRGAALAQAYAKMDAPASSHTETFGYVAREALASGAPAVATPDRGPKYDRNVETD